MNKFFKREVITLSTLGGSFPRNVISDELITSDVDSTTTFSCYNAQIVD